MRSAWASGLHLRSRTDEKREAGDEVNTFDRSEEHTPELQSQSKLVCRLLLEKKKLGASSRAGPAQRPMSAASPTAANRLTTTARVRGLLRASSSLRRRSAQECILSTLSHAG